MPDSLADLERHRANIQSELVRLGDMRSGSITSTGGRCGNLNCHCHWPGDAGHGPYYRLTRKVGAKTVTERFLRQPHWPRPSGRSPNSTVFAKWVANFWM